MGMLLHESLYEETYFLFNINLYLYTSTSLVCVCACVCLYTYTCMSLCECVLCVHVLMRDEKEGRKKQACQTNNKAKQHSTPKTVTFPKKNELPQVGLEPNTCICV